jgi:transposase-like protein
MGRSYQIVETKEREKVRDFLVKEGHCLARFVDVVEQARMGLDELIESVGRVGLEAVLELSALRLAGEKQRGRRGGDVLWHGSEGGEVPLSDRKIRVQRPRLRRRGKGRGGEVSVPAYEALQGQAKLGDRMLEILMAGVSTRGYERVIGEMAETVGVSKSSVSREVVAATEAELRKLCERPLGELDLLVIYLDGLQFGAHHVVAGIGVDTTGRKHMLGLVSGSSENATVVRGLLHDVVERGIDVEQKYLFVIDGSKALRKAIDEVFGTDQKVQRCRNHKIENVMNHLPKDLKAQVKSVLRAAFRLDAKEGMARLKKQAEWLEKEYPSAATSLLEGLEEMFTVSRLDLPGPLRRCLCTTNIIESPQSSVRKRTGRVSRWRDGKMVMRWAAASYLDAEKRFHRIMGYEHLWILASALGRTTVAEGAKVG